jgi:hypothetical protein
LDALRVADRQKGKAVRSADALVLPNQIKEIKNSIQMLQNDVSSIKTNSLSTGIQNENFNKRQGNDGSFNTTLKASKRTAIFSELFMVFGSTSLNRNLIADSGMSPIK